MDSFRATYWIQAAAEDIEARAEALLLEQTVELPRSSVRDPFVEEQILPRIDKITPDPAGGFLVSISFPVSTTAHDPAQFLNVLFGNSSLREDIRLSDLEAPPSLLASLRGPAFGIAGIRRLVDAPDRPLTCTALKPLGLPPEALGRLCTIFARAGVDVIKDDQALADHPFCPFEARVRTCQSALEEVKRETGRHAVYVPHLTGTAETAFRQLRFAQGAGVGAVMAAPMLLGLPLFWELCHRRSSVPVIAHPSFGGALRIAPEILLGTIFRLYGADAVIFPHWGGRYDYSAETCRNLAERLRYPWDSVRPALPVPAGGMSLDRIGEIIRFYGTDTMLLIAGGLYEAGDALYDRSRTFVEQVRRAAASRERG
jgi:ribulose-bisphosphate carboxylase large chain